MELRTCTASSMFSAIRPVAAMSLKRTRGLVLLATIFSLALAAMAQSVSFTGVVSPVGSGFWSPNGVAVDAKGDVFVTDWVAGAVEEIVAVNGQVSSTSTVVTARYRLGDSSDQISGCHTIVCNWKAVSSRASIVACSDTAVATVFPASSTSAA